MSLSFVDFNPTEKAWNVIKGRYRQQLTEMAAQKPITQLQFFVLVNQCYRSVTNRLMHRLLDTNDAYIERMANADF